VAAIAILVVLVILYKKKKLTCLFREQSQSKGLI
jgi:hypothetical protein